MAQVATEIVVWRREKRRIAQDEACKHHVEAYVSDIESPTKVTNPNIFVQAQSAAENTVAETLPADLEPSSEVFSSTSEFAPDK